MNCQNREVDLLMLAHGEASWTSRFRTRLHLLWCRACRSRLEEFYGVSKSLAIKLENPHLGVRKIRRPSVVGGIGALIVIVLFLLTTLGFIAYRQSVAIQQLGAESKTQTFKIKPHQVFKKVKSSPNLSSVPCD